MSKEKADRTLVNALRKHGLSSIAKAHKLLVDAYRLRKPAATADTPLHSEEEAYRVQD